MDRIRQDNPNTRNYWNDKYNSFIDREKAKTDSTWACAEVSPIKAPSYRFAQTIQEIKNRDIFLDIGCGVGVMCQLVYETYPRCEVWGTDFSGQVVQGNIVENPKIKYLCREIGKHSDLPQNYFDVIFCSEVLEHLDQPELLFSDAYGLLKSGGKLIITTPWNNRVASGEHIWSFEKEDIERYFKKGGFNNIRFVDLPEMESTVLIYCVGEK